MKLLLLGLSGSGKSTVSKLIAEKFSLNLYEADDEVEKYNGGTWPDSDEAITKGFEIANEKVIKSDNIVYVISWLTQEEVKKFFNAGFIFFEMHADFEELVKRKKVRDNITPEKIEKFKLTYIEYFNTVLPEEMLEYYKLSLDTTNMTTDQIFEIIVDSCRV